MLLRLRRELNYTIEPCAGGSNVEHYRQVDRAIRAHPGERILITFGAGHRHWLQDQLRRRVASRGPFAVPVPYKPRGSLLQGQPEPHVGRV